MFAYWINRTEPPFWIDPAERRAGCQLLWVCPMASEHIPWDSPSYEGELHLWRAERSVVSRGTLSGPHIANRMYDGGLPIFCDAQVDVFPDSVISSFAVTQVYHGAIAFEPIDRRGFPSFFRGFRGHPRGCMIFAADSPDLRWFGALHYRRHGLLRRHEQWILQAFSADSSVLVQAGDRTTAGVVRAVGG